MNFLGSYYCEKNLCFGFKRGSDIFQRLSDIIRFIMAQEGHYILNDLDDHLIFGHKHQCSKGFDRLTEILKDISDAACKKSGH